MQIRSAIKSFFSICLFFVFLNNNSESLIYLPLKNEIPIKEMYQQLVKPQNNTYIILKKIGSIPPLMGILATYAGYLTASNEFGEIIFPRHQEKTPLYIAISEEIIPIMRSADVIDYWEFSRTKQTVFIEIDLEKKNNDTLEEKFVMNIISLPEDNIVPYPTITIFADPDDFEISKENFINNQTTHWILPPLIVKKNATFTKNMIPALSFLQFFHPLKILIQKPNTKEFIKIQK